MSITDEELPELRRFASRKVQLLTLGYFVPPCRLDDSGL